MILEIACFNLESALIAQRAGADRIEFCDDYSSGGITPSGEKIIEARKKISIPLFVMVRPRKGSFIYSDSEAKEMRQQISFCRTHKINGIVFGALDKGCNIDKKLCKELVSLAHPMQITYHRSFDEVDNTLGALEDIIECGCTRLLTSGGKLTALEGAELISTLARRANGRITILPGGGIRSHNILGVKAKTGASEFHSAALNLSTMLADEDEIRKLKSLLQ
jgi:copper homeostasis protein